jgi:type VI secretion system secreted protein VgrG
VVLPHLAAVTAAAVVSVLVPAPALAADPVDLGTAANFSVLAGQTITNTGPTTAQQDIGVHPGTAIVGFPPGTTEGEPHAADDVAEEAKVDLTAAYIAAAEQEVDATIGTQLGGQVITPGTYDSGAGTFQITGTLTLDAQGDTNSVFIFQTESTLITASRSRVVLINGAALCNVFWRVGSSATLGTYSTFAGNILALTSITAFTGAYVQGRLLARNGSVTMGANTITEPVCGAAPPPPDVNPPDVDQPDVDQPDVNQPDGPNLPVTGGGREGGGAVPMLAATGGVMILIGGLMMVLFRRRTSRSPF